MLLLLISHLERLVFENSVLYNIICGAAKHLPLWLQVEGWCVACNLLVRFPLVTDGFLVNNLHVLPLCVWVFFRYNLKRLQVSVWALMVVWPCDALMNCSSLDDYLTNSSPTQWHWKGKSGRSCLPGCTLISVYCSRYCLSFSASWCPSLQYPRCHPTFYSLTSDTSLSLHLFNTATVSVLYSLYKMLLIFNI